MPLRPVPLFIAIVALAGLLALGLWLPERDALGRPLPLALGLGVMFGIALQRSRFCFWCISRDFFDDRDPRGFLGILVALAIGLIGYTAVFGAWMPNPGLGRLPPDAHIGPVSFTLALASFVFGLGMAASGSCISAHFYRLGEGAFSGIIAIIGAAGGFILGFLTWNWFWFAEVRTAPVVWLPASLGYGGALAAQLAVIALLAALLVRIWPRDVVSPLPGTPATAIFAQRWPAYVGGLIVGWIAVISFFRVGPLGVTAELGSLARTGAEWAEWLPATLQGLDSLAGCMTVVKEALISRNGVFVIGLIGGAFAAAQAAGDWKPTLPRLRDIPRLFLGGVALGWGAMTALGCTVGVLLSGIMAGSLSGWVFLVACLAGAWLGWLVRFRLRSA